MSALKRFNPNTGEWEILIAAKEGAAGGKGVMVVEVTEGPFTLNENSAGQYLLIDSANTNEWVVLSYNDLIDFPTGEMVTIEQYGEAFVGIHSVGVTVNSLWGGAYKWTPGKHAVLQLIKVSATIWTLIGGAEWQGNGEEPEYT